MDVKYIGYEVVGWTHIAHNRAEWRDAENTQQIILFN